MESILTRIQALELKTVDSGCTPAEAAAAKAKAEELRRKYNVPRSAKPRPRPQPRPAFVINLNNGMPVTPIDYILFRVAADRGMSVIINDVARGSRYLVRPRIIRESITLYKINLGPLHLFPYVIEQERFVVTAV